jgi:glutathione S-transferase
MKLYSGPLSLFTAKVRIALAEKHIACERVEVPFSRANGYTPKHPDVLALNPKAQVPVLVDGDLALYDSTLITEYLEDVQPLPPLYPKEPADRARVRQAEAASDEIFFPHVWTLIRSVYYGSPTDPAAVPAARLAIAATHRELDARLAGREWLCGEYSVADIAYFLTCLFAANLGRPRRVTWRAARLARAHVRAPGRARRGRGAARGVGARLTQRRTV